MRKETLKPPATVKDSIDDKMERVQKLCQSLGCSAVAATFIVEGKAIVTIEWDGPTAPAYLSE